MLSTQNVTVKRVVALIVGCLCMSIAGSVYCYGVYIVAVKKHFSYSQFEVEIFGSMSNFGISLGFPAGLMCERIGPRWASLTGLLVSTSGYLLLWSTTLMTYFYSTNAGVGLQACFYFISGFGAIFLYMAAMTTCTMNFHPRNRGKIVGLLDASFSAGPAIMAIVYGRIFAVGHVHDEENQNLGGFYLTTSIVFAVFGLMGVFFLGKYPYDMAEDDEIVLTVNDSQIEGTFNVETPSTPVKNIPWLKLVRRFDYHFIAWSYIFCAGLQLMFQNNIQTYLKTFNLEQYTTLFGTINPVCGVLAKFAVGFLSDAIVHKVPRVTLLLAFNIVQTITLIFCIFLSDKFPMLIVTLIVIGCANGAVWCLTPTMISEFYGLAYFGRNWGATIFGNAIGGTIVQQVYGWTYDNYVITKGSSDCIAGVRCFTWSFTMAAVLSFCACICNVGLWQYLNDKKNREKGTDKPSSELRIQ